MQRFPPLCVSPKICHYGSKLMPILYCAFTLLLRSLNWNNEPSPSLGPGGRDYTRVVPQKCSGWRGKTGGVSRCSVCHFSLGKGRRLQDLHMIGGRYTRNMATSIPSNATPNTSLPGFCR